MKYFFIKTLFTFSVVVFVTAASAAPGSRYGGFTFGSDLTAGQVKIIKDDIDFMFQLPLMADHYGLSQMTEMKTVSGPDIHNWILNRLRFFISEGVNPDHLFSLTKQFYAYENSAMMPKLKSGISGTNQENDIGSVIATNIGGSIYIIGKKQQTLGMATVNGKSMPVLSPRVGIVQVPNTFFEGSEDASKQLIGRLLRITTLFHEARHSDGNGLSLGFLHDVCPKGDLLEGKLACDKMENGSYGLEARLQRVLSRNCVSCKTEDVEILRLMSLQNFSRLILSAPATAKVSRVRQEMDANNHILEICKTLSGENEKCSSKFVKETKQKYVDSRAQLDYLIRVSDGSKPLRPVVDAKPEGFFHEILLEESKTFFEHQ